MQNCFCFLKGLGKISQNTSFPWPIFSCMQRKSTFCPYMGKYESGKTHILSDIAQWPSWSLRSIRTHWKIRWNHNLVFFHFFIFLLKSWVRRFQAKMIIRMKKTTKKKKLSNVSFRQCTEWFKTLTPSKWLSWNQGQTEFHVIVLINANKTLTETKPCR